MIAGGMDMIASLVRKAALLALSFALTACVSLGGGGDLPDQLISLTPDNVAPAGDLDTVDGAAAIVVLDPDASRRLDVTRVPVQVDAANVAYLQDAVWVEKPARQFRSLLAETIRAKSRQVVVEGSDSEVIGRTVVSGRLLDMGYDAQVQAVIVRFDAIVEGTDGKIRSRRFEAEVLGISPKAAFIAPALNEAANDVAAQVAEWVGS